MRIKGMGFIPKKEVLSVLSDEGLEAYNKREISLGDAANLYKRKLVMCLSKTYHEDSQRFNKILSYIPERVFFKLSITELADLIDSIKE